MQAKKLHLSLTPAGKVCLDLKGKKQKQKTSNLGKYRISQAGKDPQGSIKSNSWLHMVVQHSVAQGLAYEQPILLPPVQGWQGHKAMQTGSDREVGRGSEGNLSSWTT